MLKFLKNIFMQKEIKNEEINLNELEGWIESNKKIILNDLNKKTDEIMSRISNEVRKCNENLRALENAELANPKIPLRAKQAMEGNRETYIKRINLFLAGLITANSLISALILKFRQVKWQKALSRAIRFCSISLPMNPPI